jgi:hypothetical protein
MVTPRSYVIQESQLRQEQGLGIVFDFSARHEIAGGKTIVSAVMDLMLKGVASADITVSAPAVDPTGKLVSCSLTPTKSGLAANEYRLVCQPTLNDGTKPVVEAGALLVMSVS